MSNASAMNGLLVTSEYLDIISDNIANASTVGYKSKRPVFFDMFSHSCYSNTNHGCGVSISHVMQNFNNGMLIATERNLDLGILNDGFFRVLDDQGHVHYTRDGQFFIDDNKNITNKQGMYLTGQNISHEENGSTNTSNLEPINFQHARILQSKPTSEIKFKAILNRSSNSTVKLDSFDNKLFPPEECITYTKVYNKNGEEKKIKIFFRKKDIHTWTAHAKLEGESDSINNTMDLLFNADGKLISDANFNIKLSHAKKDQNININFSDTTEQASTTSAIEESPVQDGYPKGLLKEIHLSSNGEIIATYSNQKVQTIGKILLSKFVNPEKLQPESGNLWSATPGSGAAIVDISNDKNVAILHHKTLEASNVDLNKELINMIIAQRNYQSNAQSFKTEDKIINTLINLR